MKEEFRTILCDGKEYKYRVLSRPFREGLEIRIQLGDEDVVIAELGLGDTEIERRIITEIRKRTTAGPLSNL